MAPPDTLTADRPIGARDEGYDGDLYTWAMQQAEHLRRGEWSKLDAANVAEEIEEVGRELYNRLESALRVILLHFLKWDHQPERRSRSWTVSIRTRRVIAERILARHRGLTHRLDEAVGQAYRLAVIEAAGETGLDDEVFPPDCPYALDEIMNRPIPWPATEGGRS